MAEEPLYCPRCGAEDFGCSCNLVSDFKPVFCETCGVRLPCEFCERMGQAMKLRIEPAIDPLQALRDVFWLSREARAVEEMNRCYRRLRYPGGRKFRSALRRLDRLDRWFARRDGPEFFSRDWSQKILGMLGGKLVQVDGDVVQRKPASGAGAA
jgi:hypothetical protein